MSLSTPAGQRAEDNLDADLRPDKPQQFQPLAPSARRDAILARSTGTYPLFDKLRHRDSVTPDADRIAFIDANAKSCKVKPDKLRFDHEIITVAANLDARQAIATQDPFWRLLEAEVAVEITFAHREDAVELHHLLDSFLVRSARQRLRIVTSGRDEQISSEEAEARRLAGLHTSYLADRKSGFNLVWYSRYRSKVTGEWCLKLEARIKGAAQLRRFGISNATLCSFDLVSFLDAQYRLAVPDPLLVARHHLRRHPQPVPSPTRHYPNPIHRLGCFLVRLHSEYPGEVHQFRSTQAFVAAVRSSASLIPI